MAVVINGTTGITAPTETIATTLGVGGATPAASGAGITFPATQSASTDANTLDDYEEGTWTPGLTINNSATGITFSNQVGKYTKIGNMVYAGFYFELTNKGSSSGQVRITSLPFTSNSSEASRMGNCAGYFNNFAAAVTSVLLLVEPSSTVSILRYGGAGIASDMNQASVNNNSAIYGVYVYQV